MDSFSSAEALCCHLISDSCNLILILFFLSPWRILIFFLTSLFLFCLLSLKLLFVLIINLPHT